MAQEVPEIMTSLFEAILAYQDTQEGLARVRQTAESLWGAMWRQKLPSALQDCPEENKAKVKANIDRALTYEKAGSVWAEVARLLDPKRPIDPAQLKPRMPEMQKWLAIFGAAGQDMFAKLQQKVSDAESNPNAVVVASQTYGLTDEQMWNFEHFLRLKDYYDQTISRTSARCVHLGGLEITQYPYYGFILDLLDEIISFGKEIINTPVYAPIIRDRFKGGAPALKKILEEFRHDFRSNAPPEMLEDDDEAASIEDVKSQLGMLVEDEEEEDIGPAPDGFSPDDFASAQTSPAPQKAPASQPAPVQKAPASQPATVQKAPVPQGGGEGPVSMGTMTRKVPVAKAPQSGVNAPAPSQTVAPEG